MVTVVCFPLGCIIVCRVVCVLFGLQHASNLSCDQICVLRDLSGLLAQVFWLSHSQVKIRDVIEL